MYEKNLFGLKLAELGANNEITHERARIPCRRFSFMNWKTPCEAGSEGPVPRYRPRDGQGDPPPGLIQLLGFRVSRRFPSASSFPPGPGRGREWRMLGSCDSCTMTAPVVYYATYTAFDGREVLPQLIETEDFVSFRVGTLNGNGAEQGHGAVPATDPWKYVVLSRSDRENNVPDALRQCALLERDRSCCRAEAVLGTDPDRQLRLAHRDRGGLARADARRGADAPLRHRRDALDLDDPARVIAQLPEPLMVPEDDEREGTCRTCCTPAAACGTATN